MLWNQAGCVAEPPLEAMISQALSPSGKPPRTVLRSFPDFAPTVVRMSTGKPMKVAGSGPWRFWSRETSRPANGLISPMKKSIIRLPRVPFGGTWILAVWSVMGPPWVVARLDFPIIRSSSGADIHAERHGPRAALRGLRDAVVGR